MPRFKFELEADCEEATADAVLRIFNNSLTQALSIANAAPVKPATATEIKATKGKK